MAHKSSGRIQNGSMHGVELGSFVCASGKERTVHAVSMHAVILASGSLRDADEEERYARAMQTINFLHPEDLAGMRVPRRCRDCTLSFWQTCNLPKQTADSQREQRQMRELPETVLG